MEKYAAYIQAIHDIYPDLVIETAHLNQNGQFNDILIVNDEIIFRFPKTVREAEKLSTETQLLQCLQDQVPLPVPNPIYHSKTTAVIGHTFMGYHLLPGEPLWPQIIHTQKDEELLQHLADQLATFLHQLHTISVENLNIQLPTFRGNEKWQELYQHFREKLFPFMRQDARQWVIKHFETFLNDQHNYDYEPALIHGDFGPGNILYDARTQSVSGIIDFSSTGWGDPANDFASILCTVSYGEAFLKRFATLYLVDDAMISRARFYAGTFALQEALYGLVDGDQKAFERGIAEYR